MTGSFSHVLAAIITILPAFLISLSFHEFSHALVATLLGDDTPKRMGRLTLNPLSHIDPMGLLFLIVFRIGWAKPVVFNQQNFKYPRFYSVLTALAGPLSNFILAIIFFYLQLYTPMHYFSRGVAITLSQIFEVSASVNIMLGVFNMLPIPPLDGSHILIVMLSKRFPRFVTWLYQYSMFILIALFIFPPTRLFLVRIIAWVTEIILKLIIF